MSIIKAVQDYLEDYDGMSLIPITDIQTDYTPAMEGAFALAPYGNSVIKQDVLGNKTYQNSYIFFARERASDETDRQGMYDFLENLSAWLEEQADSGNYPTLPTGYEADGLSVSNYGLYEIENSGLAIYQVQISLTIIRR